MESNIVALVDGAGVVKNIIVAGGIVDGRNHQGFTARWVYEGAPNPRKNYATIGGTYDAERDAFVDVKPGPEYVLNEATCRWELPE